MKKLLFVFVALLLAGCASFAPAPAPTPAPLPTALPPEVVVVTVVVPATPLPQPTAMPEVPTPMPQPTAMPEVPTAAPAAEQPTGITSIPDALGGGFFNQITITGDKIFLRCSPSTITFTVTPMNPYIVDVELWYRMEDRQGTYITEWKNRGAMKVDGNGNFTLTFDVMDIHPDLRYYEKTWLDFEFVGLNKSGDVVGRSDKINQIITYQKECK